MVNKIINPAAQRSVSTLGAWTWCDLNGSHGGYSRPGSRGTTYIVCTEFPGSGQWILYHVRDIDAHTLKATRHASRGAAMGAAK